MGNRQLNRPGFTLLELLVVIGIIAVLATLIGVVVSRARGGANKFQLAAQLQTISVGLDAYKTEFGSFPVTTPDVGPVTATGTLVAPQTIHPRFHLDREGLRGARLLCKALMGQTGAQFDPPGPPFAAGGTYALNRANQDGKAGLGFTVPGRTGVATYDGAVGNDAVGNMAGKTYGPYLNPDKFKIANTATDADAANGIEVRAVLPGTNFDDRAVLLDANGSPILYFPSLNAQPTVTLPFAYLSKGRADGLRDIGTAEAKASSVTEADYGSNGGAVTTTPTNLGSGTPAFNGVDNAAWLPTPVLRYLLGDTDLSGRYEAASNEKTPIRNEYILWTAGPDGKFGPRNGDGSSAGVRVSPAPQQTPAEKASELKAALVANRYDDVNNLPE